MTMVTNRTLVLFQYAGRLVILLALVGGLIYGLVMRIINGEGYLGFLVAILALLEKMHLPFLDETPGVHFPVQPRPGP